MATYINPDAVKDGSLSKSKLDTALANEINGKLTDAPKDGKVYGRSDGEWVGLGDEWKLIETLTLEEEVSVIEKSIEPNGDAYAFKDIAIIISNVKQSTWKSAVVFRFNFNKELIYGCIENSLRIQCVEAFKDISFTSPIVKCMARLVNINNVVQIGITTPTTNPGYIQGYPDTRASHIAINNAGALISSLRIYSDTLPFLPNTRIEIYAIR